MKIRAYTVDTYTDENAAVLYEILYYGKQIATAETLEEAHQEIERHETRRQRRNANARARHEAYTSSGMTRTPYGYE